MISILLFIILTILAFIHFNWVIGGKWGMDKALPTQENGKRLFNPGKIASATVGIGLFLFGLFQLAQGGWINIKLPHLLFIALQWGIPIIFLLRAIGDFKYVGLFKKIRSTPFAKMDAKFYTPLCLIIAGLSGWGLW